MPRKRRPKRSARRRSRWKIIVILTLLIAVAYAIRRTDTGPVIVDTVRDAVSDAIPQQPPPTAGTGSIRVHFAPASRLMPGDLDNAFLDALASARESLFCAIYDLEWHDAADVLIERHRAGVTVQIVSDTEYQARDAIRRCVDAGIPVRFDDRSAFMHNKFVVVDGESVWTGSMNITENGLFRNNNNALFIVSDRLAANYRTEFEEMFGGAFGARSPENTQYPTFTIDGIQIENYFAPEDDVEEEIIAEIDTASEIVRFMAFSYTAEPIAKAMARRMEAGVQVMGVFESRNAGSQYSRDDWLAERGAGIYMDTNPRTMHHKVIVVDTRTVVTGSYNFSKSADQSNDENVLIIHDSEIATQYIAEFDRLTP